LKKFSIQNRFFNKKISLLKIAQPFSFDAFPKILGSKEICPQKVYRAFWGASIKNFRLSEVIFGLSLPVLKSCNFLNILIEKSP
jgi:hypothetical protein